MNRTAQIVGAVVVLALAAAAFAWFASRTNGPKPDLHPVGSYSVGLRNEPSPPRTGENALEVVIEDGKGRPVRGARVETVVSMPAMGAMPYMESRGRVTETAPGAYRVAYGLAMPGEWDIALKITAPGAEPAEGRWRLSTHLPDVAFAGGEAEAQENSPGGSPGTIVLDDARRQAIGVRTARVERRDLVAPVRARGTRRVRRDCARRGLDALQRLGALARRRLHREGGAARRRPVHRRQPGDRVGAAGVPDRAEVFRRGFELPCGCVRRRRRVVGEHAHARRGGAPAPPVVGADPRPGRARREHGPAARPDGREIPGGRRRAREVDRRRQPVHPGAGAAVDRARRSGVDRGARVRDRPAARARGYASRASRAARSGGPRVAARVTFVAPALDEQSRTGVARIQLSNPGGALRPGMFVDVDARRRRSAGGSSCPRARWCRPATRQVVFVDQGDGRLAPREVDARPARGRLSSWSSGASRQATRSSPRATSSWPPRAACARRSGSGEARHDRDDHRLVRAQARRHADRGADRVRWRAWTRCRAPRSTPSPT